MYMRENHVNKLESVLLKLFKCLSCESNGKFQLKRHLGIIYLKVTFNDKSESTSVSLNWRRLHQQD